MKHFALKVRKADGSVSISAISTYIRKLIRTAREKSPAVLFLCINMLHFDIPAW